MSNPLQAWFDVLIAVHDRCRDLSQFTAADLKAFAGQAPATVLPAVQQANLAAFLDQRFNQRVPTSSFALATFQLFVEDLVGRLELILLGQYFSVAVAQTPSLASHTPTTFGALPVTTAFPNQPARDALFLRIDSASPTDYFPATPANQTRFNTLLQGPSTVLQAVKATY